MSSSEPPHGVAKAKEIEDWKMKREHQHIIDAGGDWYAMAEHGKGKTAMGRDENGGVDELLAALGYKVRSSDMADVALKLEQLEMAMGSSAAASDDVLLSHLAFDAVHYNPSDLSTWVDNILSELNAPPHLPPPPPPPASLHCHFDLSTAVAEQTNTVNVGPAVCQGGSGDAYDLKPLPSPASSGRIVSMPEHQSDTQGEGSEAGEGAQAERGARGVWQATQRIRGQQRHRELERAAASASRGGKGSNVTES